MHLFASPWQATKASYLCELTRRKNLCHRVGRDESGILLRIIRELAVYDRFISYKLFLLNLSSRKKIVLTPPPQDNCYISDAIITSSPTGNRRRMILLYRRDRNVFLFHRLFKHHKWEMVNCNVKDGISTPVRCNDVIYVLAGPRRKLAVIDVDGPCPKVTMLPVEDRPQLYFMEYEEQLLESCAELFLVCMYYKNFTKRLFTFEVYILDSCNMQWVAETNLADDRAFILGTCSHWYWYLRRSSCSTSRARHSGLVMSCSASRAGMVANCIYFIDDFDHSTIFKFDLADESVLMEMSWPSIPKPWAQAAWINIFDS